MGKELYVLLGDVISSRKIKDRECFQEKLMGIYEDINVKYSEDIYADFKIIKGLDEIGCALNKLYHVYDIITTILDQIYPESMRFVLVRGYVDTGLEKRDITKMDGPAFHKAASMMASLKESKAFFSMSINNHKQLSDDLVSKVMDDLVSKVVNFAISDRENWTKRQRQIIRDYEKTGNQKEVADKYGITQQAVSKNLKNANWKEIKELEDSLRDLLKRYSLLDGLD